MIIGEGSKAAGVGNPFQAVQKRQSQWGFDRVSRPSTGDNLPSTAEGSRPSATEGSPFAAEGNPSAVGGSPSAVGGGPSAAVASFAVDIAIAT